MTARCGGIVIKHFPHPLAFEGFWEIVPTICAPLNSPTRINGPQYGLSRNCSPCSSFIAAVGYSSPNNRHLLRHLLRLSNGYCTTITLIFLHGGVFQISPYMTRGLAACSVGLFNIFLFLTLAPRDYITYYQAWGLSGHTSP